MSPGEDGPASYVDSQVHQFSLSSIATTKLGHYVELSIMRDSRYDQWPLGNRHIISILVIYAINHANFSNDLFHRAF